jgi:hypothetical protein
MKSLVQNAADPKQVQDAEKRVKRGRERELEDMRLLLDLPPARRFMWRFLEDCGVFRSSWDPTARIHFNEGRRDIGLKLLAEITEAAPEALLKMMNEARQKEGSE